VLTDPLDTAELQSECARMKALSVGLGDQNSTLAAQVQQLSGALDAAKRDLVDWRRKYDDSHGEALALKEQNETLAFRSTRTSSTEATVGELREALAQAQLQSRTFPLSLSTQHGRHALLAFFPPPPSCSGALV
jgi:hypothetical protein